MTNGSHLSRRSSDLVRSDGSALRVAVPNKGQMAGPAKELLQEAGYLLGARDGQLLVVDRTHNAEFFFLRPRDIAIYVGEGTLDVGITGEDLLADSGAPACALLSLGFAPSSFYLAAPRGQFTSVVELSGKRIATAYPGLLRSFLDEQGMPATIVKLDGAVENAVALGVADAIADVVATGTTLRRAGLEVIGDPIASSQAVLVRRCDAPLTDALEVFLRRLSSVMTAREYVLVEYIVSSQLLDAACNLTPGLQSPTITPLSSRGLFAVRSMVPSISYHAVLDELYSLGASSIIVTDVHACRL